MSFLKKPWVITVGICLGVIVGYGYLKAKNPGGYFDWLP